jgi:hypothetical protein
MKEAPLYIASETIQYVILGITILCALLVLVLSIVYFNNNLIYIEIVLEKAYNLDEEM